jgi:AcrR family transcriptional regulator
MPKPKKARTSTASTPKRKRRKPEEIRSRLIQAAGAEFMDAGYKGATTAAIAKRAEVTEAQLFRCFPSKLDLFKAAVFDPLDKEFADFNAQRLQGPVSEDDYRGQARTYIVELQKFIDEHSRMLMSLLVADAYDPESRQGVSDIGGLRDYFRQGAEKESGRLKSPPQIDPELMVRVSFATVLGCELFKDWLFPARRGGKRKISDAIVDFVLDGLSANDKSGAAKSRF